MATSSVPVTLHWLGSKGADNSKVLTHAVHQIAGNPHVISGVDSLAWANLVLPLTGHDLSIGSRDGYARIETALVVSLNDGTTVRPVSSDTAVIRSLGRREAEGGEAEGASVLVQGVLLLKSKPRLVSL